MSGNLPPEDQRIADAIVGLFRLFAGNHGNTDVPTLPDGATVHVAPDAPLHADRYGTVADSQIRDDMPGYWVRLTDPSEVVWIPAGALAVIRVGGAQ